MYPITLKTQATNEWLGNMYHALSITMNYKMEICKWNSLWTGVTDILHSRVASSRWQSWWMHSDCASHPLLAAVTYPWAAGTQPQSSQTLTDHSSAITVHFLATNCFSFPILPFQKWVAISQEHTFKTSVLPQMSSFLLIFRHKECSGEFSGFTSGPSSPLLSWR